MKFNRKFSDKDMYYFFISPVGLFIVYIGKDKYYKKSPKVLSPIVTKLRFKLALYWFPLTSPALSITSKALIFSLLSPSCSLSHFYFLSLEQIRNKE